MRVLIVDDEEPARRRLARLLAALPDVTIAGEAADGIEALARIQQVQPDLVLLDIRMPELDGLALAQQHRDLPPLIFTTAYDEHAVAAFEVHAVDYLLKPISPERLARALDRARARTAQEEARAQATLAALGAERAAIPRVSAVDRGALRIFDAREITRFWSSERYTVFLGEGRELLTQEPLAELEQRLAPHGFLRVHRAELVQLPKIRALHPQAGQWEIELSDGQRARVGRRQVAALKAALGLREP